MIVSVKPTHSPSGETSIDKWLSIGQHYIVLGIFGRRNEVLYRVFSGDDLGPALHPSGLFDVILPSLPGEWVFRTLKDKEWELTPLVWSASDFWTRYFDGDVAARTIFGSVRRQMLEADKKRMTEEKVQVRSVD